MPLLRLEAVTRRGPARGVVDRISLELAAGECLALLGEAGSGRAALLRLIAGTEEPDAGRILIEGRDVTRLPLRRRPVALLLPQDRLFGHASVFDSVGAALPEAEPGTAPPTEAVHRLLTLVGLAEDAGSMPVMLPPGKRRRLLLARALAPQPRLLLVAEAFGVADPERRGQAPRRWLREIQQRLGLGMVLVARGAEEARLLADRVAVLEAGRLRAIGTPAEVQRQLVGSDAARLLGASPAAEEARAPRLGGGLWMPADRLEVVAPGLGVPARVLGATVLGRTIRLDLELLADGSQVEAEVPSLGFGGALPPGTIIGLRVRDLGRRGDAALN